MLWSSHGPWHVREVGRRRWQTDKNWLNVQIEFALAHSWESGLLLPGQHPLNSHFFTIEHPQTALPC